MMTGEYPLVRPASGLTQEINYELPTPVGILFAGAEYNVVPRIAWDDLPRIDAMADDAMERAAQLVDPAFLEWLASRNEHDSADPQMGRDGPARWFTHAREVGALLHVALLGASPLIRTIMTAYGLTHDGGKTHPNIAAEYHDPGKWPQGKVDRLALAHQQESERMLLPLAMRDDAHFAVETVAKLDGIHHHRDLLAIRNLQVRWSVAVFQEADGAQSVLLDGREYMGDGTSREGISLRNVDALYNRIVKPFHTPAYFGLEPGRIFNIALGWREQRLAQATLDQGNH